MYSSTLPRTPRLCLCNVFTEYCIHWVWALAIHDLIFELAWSDELTFIADYKLSTSPIFSYAMLYGPDSNKLSQSIPGGYFSPFLDPGSENYQKLLLIISGPNHSLKIDFRKVLLNISGARQRKCWKSTTGGHCWPYPGPSSENTQNRLLESILEHIISIV